MKVIPDQDLNKAMLRMAVLKLRSRSLHKILMKFKMPF